MIVGVLLLHSFTRSASSMLLFSWFVAWLGQFLWRWSPLFVRPPTLLFFDRSWCTVLLFVCLGEGGIWWFFFLSSFFYCQ